MDVEQWKSDGDCTKCRKNNYCAKDCKPHRLRTQKMIQKAFWNVLSEQMEKQPMEFEEDKEEPKAE